VALNTTTLPPSLATLLIISDRILKFEIFLIFAIQWPKEKEQKDKQ
jgi:hypothetical protein